MNQDIVIPIHPTPIFPRVIKVQAKILVQLRQMFLDFVNQPPVIDRSATLHFPFPLSQAYLGTITLQFHSTK